jgi:integrase
MSIGALMGALPTLRGKRKGFQFVHRAQSSELAISRGVLHENCTVVASAGATFLKTFKRIAKPGRLERISSQTIDAFKAVRRKEDGKKPGFIISPATVNKEPRDVKAAMNRGHEWGWLPRVPKILMEKAPEKLPRFATTEHFAAMYHEGCKAAAMPRNQGEKYTSDEWWRALLCFAMLTGWRISEIMALKRAHIVDGAANTRHDDNKSKRDSRVPLRRSIREQLEKIVSLNPLVFRWAHDDHTLY